MTKPFNLENAHILKKGQLTTTKQEFMLVLQRPEHISHMVALQQEVMDGLTEAQKSYLIPRDHAYFEAHFAHGNVVLGAVVDGKLIAQSLMTTPSPEHPYTGMTDMEIKMPLSQIAVLNGTVVHPDFRGNNLQNLFVDARLMLAKLQGRVHVLSEIAVENCNSWNNLLQEGLQIHSIGVDDSDGTVLYNMHADLSKLKGKLVQQFNEKSGPNTKICAQNDIEAQKKLISSGLKGVAYDKNTKQLMFDKPAKKKNAL